VIAVRVLIGDPIFEFRVATQQLIVARAPQRWRFSKDFSGDFHLPTAEETVRREIFDAAGVFFVLKLSAAGAESNAGD
jgi:hypothetical protein